MNSIKKDRREGDKVRAPSVPAPVIKAEELKLETVVGEGQYGAVYKGKCRDTAVAVKILNNREWDDAVIFAFSKEVEIMSRLAHPNVGMLPPFSLFPLTNF